MKRYFNLRLNNSDENGIILEVDMSRAPKERIKDYISSYVNPNNNVSFRHLGNGTYKATIPKMQFSGGACVPGLAVNSGPGWSKRGRTLVNLVLEKDGTLHLPEGEKGDILQIGRGEANKAKQDEFYYSMQQLWISGA